MEYPPFVCYCTVEEYIEHYQRKYCRSPIVTFDNIEVRFRRDQFDHCFYESSNRDGIKDSFSEERAKRIDWIEATLQDQNAELYEGWDRNRKRYDGTRRVAVVVNNYVVIIQLIKANRANFITAYLADTARTIERIRNSPKWKK